MLNADAVAAASELTRAVEVLDQEYGTAYRVDSDVQGTGQEARFAIVDESTAERYLVVVTPEPD